VTWRFQAKHALGLDPGVDSGSREDSREETRQNKEDLIGAAQPAPILRRRNKELIA
jgi:hypothetical protein